MALPQEGGYKKVSLSLPKKLHFVANPDLSKLITDTLGDSEWVTNLPLLQGLTKFADEPAFQAKWLECKRTAKVSVVW